VKVLQKFAILLIALLIPLHYGNCEELDIPLDNYEFKLDKGILYYREVGENSAFWEDAIPGSIMGEILKMHLMKKKGYELKIKQEESTFPGFKSCDDCPTEVCVVGSGSQGFMFKADDGGGTDPQAPEELTIKFPKHGECVECWQQLEEAKILLEEAKQALKKALRFIPPKGNKGNPDNIILAETMIAFWGMHEEIEALLNKRQKEIDYIEKIRWKISLFQIERGFISLSEESLTIE
jgi:hypothetical protein